MRRRPVPLLFVTTALALVTTGVLAEAQMRPAPASRPPAPLAPRAAPTAKRVPVAPLQRQVPQATKYRYLRPNAKGELVVHLPEDPERIYKLAGTKEGRTAFVEQMGSEFLEALDQEGGDRLTRRYEKVVRELGDFVSKSPDRGKVDQSLRVLQTYVQGGEQTNPFAAKGKTAGYYKELNAALRGSSSMGEFRARHPDKAAFLLDEMLPAYEALPGKVNGMVFRGTALSPEEAQRLVAGTEHEFKQLAPMSTSLSVADACSFLGKNPKTVPTMMVIRSRSGKLVSWKDSAFDFEEEVLLMGKEGVSLDVRAAFMAPAPRAGDGEREILYLLLDEKPGPI